MNLAESRVRAERPFHMSLNLPERYSTKKQIERMRVGSTIFVDGEGILAPVAQMAYGSEQKLGRKFRVKRVFDGGRLRVRIERVR